MGRANPLDQYDDAGSGLVDEQDGGNPLDAFDDLPRVGAPLPPRRPPEYSTPRAPGAAVAQMEPETKWSDVPGEAVKHAWPSAVNAAKNLVAPIADPVGTYEGVKTLGKGLLSKAKGALGYERSPSDERSVDALKQFYVDRYGSEEGWKKALSEDPFGVFADMSAFIGGGGSIAARAPGMLGKIGEAATIAGRAINPVSVAGTAVGPAARGAQKYLLNYPLSFKSGASKEALDQAIEAGYRNSEPFRRHLTGEGEPTEIVDRAKAAVDQLHADRRQTYLANMQNLALSQSQIDYTKINQALQKAFQEARYGVRDRAEIMPAVQEAGREIIGWQRTPNGGGFNYHNIQGVDELKTRVGDIVAKYPIGSPQGEILGKVYRSIRDTLAEHDPNYMTAMGQYSDASDLLKQLKTTLSINPKASTETTLRKLLLTQKQKDGSKASLLAELKKVDPELPDMIAGHLLSPAVPVGFTGGIHAATSLAPHLLVAAEPVNAVTAIANLATSIPRIAGNVAYGAGRLSHPTGGLPILATAPTQIIGDLKDTNKEPPVLKNRPYFPGDDEEEPAPRPGRAAGGAVGITADRLIAMAKASRRKIQGRSKAILAQPDEHVVSALKAVNKQMQGQ